MIPILLIDNLDSFTFNLVEAFERLGADVQVLRSDVEAEAAFNLALSLGALIVISPGPGRPEDAGCSLKLIGLARGRIPLLGICLGHQAILAEAGAEVIRARRPMHGKTSFISHDCEGPFAGLAGPLRIGRYHSLGIAKVPPRFRVHAEADGLAMAVSDEAALQTGLQFHPESILTSEGDRILGNIIGQSREKMEDFTNLTARLELTRSQFAGTIAS
jgi:anthranilate synthase/aminodeoxychorismate synthase-like glutamine amidotransferase